MARPMISSRMVLLLTALGLVLALSVGATLAVGAILAAMGDASGSRVLNWVALGCAIPLAVDLFCLVLALGINSLSEPNPPDEG
jgi:hypothetical protein